MAQRAQQLRHATARPAPLQVPAWAVPALLALAVCAAWSNSFRGPFVFDDIGSIIDNPTIRADHWHELLTPPSADGQTVGGRPLLNVSFALNHAISGTAVWSYHAANLTIHVAAALLLFGLAWRTLETERFSPAIRAAALPLAGAIALLWAVHPVQTAAVTYVVQRAESLAGLLLLLTLYAFARGVASPRPARWYVVAWLACLAGMATKEIMVAAPLVVWCYDRAFVARTFRAAWRQRWRVHGALASSWVLLAALMLGTASRGGSAGFGAITSRWDYLLTQTTALSHYLRVAIWPDRLIFDHGMDVARGLAEVWPHALLVLALLGGALWAFARNHATGFLGAWFFLILAPTSTIVPVTSQTIAEHRMYLPLAALIAGVVVALYRAIGRPAFLFHAGFAALLGVATFDRNRDYQSAVTLWSDAVRQCPDNARAHTNLGTALAQAGRLEEAMQSFRAALTVYPDHASAHYNLGVALAATGRHAEALEHLATAARLEPTNANAQLNLGNALARLGRPGEAISRYTEALRLEPGSPDTELNLGLALLATNRAADAIAPLRRAIAGLPGNVDARVALGQAHARAGDFPAAVAVLEDARKLAPDHLGVRNNLANALLVAGRTSEAITHYEAILRVRPQDQAVRANLEEARALLRATSGRPRE